MLVAVGSVRSCGATTLCLALAATWPTGRRVLLVEGDPAGWTLAAASGWPPEPGLVSLAAAARRSGDPELVWAHCQHLPGGSAVLAGPPSAEAARAARGMLGALTRRLGELDADVVVDCGRLEPDSPALGMWDRSDLALIAVRPRLADLHALSAWLDDRPPGSRLPVVVGVGDGSYPDSEVAEALGVEVAGRLPWDPAGIDGLLSAPASARHVRMAPVVRAARSLAETLCAAPGAPGITTADLGSEKPSSARPWRSFPGRVTPWRRSTPTPASVNGSSSGGLRP